MKYRHSKFRDVKGVEKIGRAKKPYGKLRACGKCLKKFYE